MAEYPQDLVRMEHEIGELADDLRVLRTLSAVDIGSALNKVRVITERFCVAMCHDHAIKWGEAEPTVERMIGPLTSAGVLPRAIGLHVRTIQNNSSPGSHYQQHPLNRSHLEIALRALVEILAWRYSIEPFPARTSAGKEDTGMRVAGLAETLAWGWNGVRLLEEFIRLDYETLDSLRPADEGSPHQWAPIFVSQPDSWRMISPANGVIAGYWHFVPLGDADWRLALSGQLLDSDITVDRIPFFQLPGRYRIYMVQVCLVPGYRGTASVRLLFRSIFDVLNALAQEDVFVTDVSANAYTAEGAALCKAFSLDAGCAHSKHGTIYSGPIKRALQHPLAASVPGLRDRYQREGLL